MKIAIIGAGFTGLAAAYELQKKGHSITIFEKDAQPGGLAIGYQEKGWDWTLEKHYHHWFTNDIDILNLAKEIKHNVIVKRPHTNWLVDNSIFEFDSIKAALCFPPLSLNERIRTLLVLGLLRFNPFWQPLEKMNAHKILPKLMGEKPYRILWEPLFINKFGDFAENISLAWFWARIKKRTQSLAYPEGGFLRFAQHLSNVINEKDGIIFYNSSLTSLVQNKNKTLAVKYKTLKENQELEQAFDKVIITLPSALVLKIIPDLPKSYELKLTSLQMIGATNLVLRLKNPFFMDNTYWLSVAKKNAPVMAVVEHTKFMDKAHYNNENIVYLGNYLSTNHPNYAKSKEQLLEEYDPFLKKINRNYSKSLIDYQLFHAPFAQPIIPPNYSKFIPEMKTPLENVFLANMQQVYPWDRGTNYAVALGKKVAELI